MPGQTAKIARLTSLSCVSLKDDGSVDYWNVQETGDWSADMERGHAILREVQDFMRQEENPLVLKSILSAIKPGLTPLTATQAGFLNALCFSVAL